MESIDEHALICEYCDTEQLDTSCYYYRITFTTYLFHGGYRTSDMNSEHLS